MRRANRNVLAVDDEPRILEAVAAMLESKGFHVITAQSGRQALSMFEAEPIALVVLDWMLPDLSGAEVCAAIRRKSRVPIVMLTARAQEEDLLQGLSMGADDYILKPFEPAEMLARIDAVLRRTGHPQEIYADGGLRVDFQARMVWHGGEALTLTAQEYDLLRVLITQRNIALSREQLLRMAWGYDYAGETRTVDVHIQRLRQKLDTGCIETVYKFGYRFAPKGGKRVEA